MQGGFSNDTLHHALHKTTVNPRHRKAIGACRGWAKSLKSAPYNKVKYLNRRMMEAQAGLMTAMVNMMVLSHRS